MDLYKCAQKKQEQFGNGLFLRIWRNKTLYSQYYIACPYLPHYARQFQRLLSLQEPIVVTHVVVPQGLAPAIATTSLFYFKQGTRREVATMCLSGEAGLSYVLT